ncbi:hypothetical protein MAR_020851 [Mya arenaria]|uniref:Transmembrane protein 231 n=1 Tax=Mya arenaria TaxID=6604 RepID=A0ABY7E641_MYAAR|nr:hypothetical protein MAR_020851 [Mya arenaria]
MSGSPCLVHNTTDPGEVFYDTAQFAISDTVKLINDVLYFVVILMKQIKAENARQAYSIDCYKDIYSHVSSNESAIHLHTFPGKEYKHFIFTRPLCAYVPFHRNRRHSIKTTCFIAEPTDLGNNLSFMKTYTWIQNLFRYIIPLVVLTFLNPKIIHKLKREGIKGKSL